MGEGGLTYKGTSRSFTMHGAWSPCVASVATMWQSYPPRGTSGKSSSIRVFVQFSDLIFGEAVGGLLLLKMGHVGYRWKS